MPWRCARSRISVIALASALGRSKVDSSSSMRPASILERSRMSLMSESRCRPDSWMSFRYSACFSLISPNMRSVSTSEKPMIALSGVLSSCDMLARNSDLWLVRDLELRALLLDLAEQAHVLDRDDGLVGEGAAAARSACRVKRARPRVASAAIAPIAGRRAASAPQMAVRQPAASRGRRVYLGRLRRLDVEDLDHLASQDGARGRRAPRPELQRVVVEDLPQLAFRSAAGLRRPPGAQLQARPRRA